MTCRFEPGIVHCFVEKCPPRRYVPIVLQLSNVSRSPSRYRAQIIGSTTVLARCKDVSQCSVYICVYQTIKKIASIFSRICNFFCRRQGSSLQVIRSSDVFRERQACAFLFVRCVDNALDGDDTHVRIALSFGAEMQIMIARLRLAALTIQSRYATLTTVTWRFRSSGRDGRGEVSELENFF